MAWIYPMNTTLHQSIPSRLFTFTDKIGNLFEVIKKGKDIKYLTSISKPYTEKVFATYPGYRFASYNLNQLLIKDSRGFILERYKLNVQIDQAKSNPSGSIFLLHEIGKSGLIIMYGRGKFKIDKKVTNFGFLTDKYYYLEEDEIIYTFRITESDYSFSYDKEFFFLLYNGYFTAQEENGIYLYQLIEDDVVERGLLLKYNSNYKEDDKLTARWLKNFFRGKKIDFRGKSTLEELKEVYYKWMTELSILDPEGIIQLDLVISNFSFNEKKLICSYSYGTDHINTLKWELKEGKVVGKPEIQLNGTTKLMLLSNGQIVTNDIIGDKYFENLFYGFCSSDPIKITKILFKKLPGVLITEVIGFL